MRASFKLTLGVGLALLPLALAFGAALDGCVLGDFELGEPDAGGGGGGGLPDAKNDAMTDAGPEAAPPMGCGYTYPDPPGTPDDGIDFGPIVVAFHTIDLGDLGDTPGYDLDNTCTCYKDAGGTCVPRGSSKVVCDFDGGIDNEAANLFKLFELQGGGAFSSTAFTEGANSGRWSLLLRITGYNGKANDEAVQVALYPSPGVQIDGGMPNWDGNDKWGVSSNSVDGGVGAPFYTSNGAYVTNHVLVAALPTIPITISGGQSTMSFMFTDGFITGTLTPMGTPQGGNWKLLSGQVAARWPLTDIFLSLASYRDTSGHPLCTTDSSYVIAKPYFCDAPDILAMDGVKSETCNAVSVGLGFTADPAMFGTLIDAGGAPGDACAPGTDPANDTCN